MIWWIILGWILTQLETPGMIWALYWVLVLLEIAFFIVKAVIKR